MSLSYIAAHDWPRYAQLEIDAVPQSVDIEIKSAYKENRIRFVRPAQRAPAERSNSIRGARMNDLKVCWWPIDKPIPYARNSRKIPERAIDKVAASIQEFVSFQ